MLHKSTSYTAVVWFLCTLRAGFTQMPWCFPFGPELWWGYTGTYSDHLFLIHLLLLLCGGWYSSSKCNHFWQKDIDSELVLQLSFPNFYHAQWSYSVTLDLHLLSSKAIGVLGGHGPSIGKVYMPSIVMLDCSATTSHMGGSDSMCKNGRVVQKGFMGTWWV